MLNLFSLFTKESFAKKGSWAILSITVLVLGVVNILMGLLINDTSSFTMKYHQNITFALGLDISLGLAGILLAIFSISKFSNIFNILEEDGFDLLIASKPINRWKVIFAKVSSLILTNMLATLFVSIGIFLPFVIAIHKIPVTDSINLIIFAWIALFIIQFFIMSIQMLFQTIVNKIFLTTISIVIPAILFFGNTYIQISSQQSEASQWEEGGYIVNGDKLSSGTLYRMREQGNNWIQNYNYDVLSIFSPLAWATSFVSQNLGSDSTSGIYQFENQEVSDKLETISLFHVTKSDKYAFSFKKPKVNTTETFSDFEDIVEYVNSIFKDESTTRMSKNVLIKAISKILIQDVTKGKATKTKSNSNIGSNVGKPHPKLKYSKRGEGKDDNKKPNHQRQTHTPDLQKHFGINNDNWAAGFDRFLKTQRQTFLSDTKIPKRLKQRLGDDYGIDKDVLMSQMSSYIYFKALQEISNNGQWIQDINSDVQLTIGSVSSTGLLSSDEKYDERLNGEFTSIMKIDNDDTTMSIKKVGNANREPMLFGLLGISILFLVIGCVLYSRKDFK
ncbi:MAG: ABC transporter permease [Mycoplasmataceae bacterium]|nr:ABC transporter permease [Mycoplasmataceae bacterium]